MTVEPSNRPRMASPYPRTLTIRQAAAVTGLTDKALYRRIARGTLRSVLRDGRRLIPATELLRSGLIPETHEMGKPPMDGMHRFPGGSTLGISAVELLDRLQAQAVEIGELRALTADADAVRLQASQEERRADGLEAELLALHAQVAEVLELRAQVAELQARQPRRRLLSRLMLGDR